MAILNYSPLTGIKIGEFKETPLSSIKNIVKESKKAQLHWKKLSKSDRISFMLKVKKEVDKNSKKIIDTINKECGFDPEEIKGVIFDVLDGFDYYINVYKNKNDLNFPIDSSVFPESTSKIKFSPLGVIAQIGAWNYPFWQTMISAIPALLTGNSIIFKPSEKAIGIGLLTAQIFKSLPKNVFQCIIGSAAHGKELVKSETDAIIYTGNIEVGKEIIKNAGIKPLILELSGNDAAIVLKDCDLNQTIQGITSGAFLHSGEVCDRIKRVYVVKEIANKLIEGIIKKTKEINVTPLISEDHLLNVHKQVNQTIKQGANLLLGGKQINKPGYYYEPTILEIKTNDIESVNNEIFGPVISIMVVDSVEQAIESANSTKFGLGTSIWIQDFKKAELIADKCESGMVWVNDSNIPLVCGEYFKGWKNTSIVNASDRLSLFLKSKTLISFNSRNSREWWF